MAGRRHPQGVPHPHADLVVPLLPSPPARVLEIGCGPEGGFVPTLVARGDDAVGVDPHAPDGPAYRRVPIEDLADPGPLDAVVAGVSLHHVADLGVVLDRAAGWLAPGGADPRAPAHRRPSILVLEWGWERFDEAAARWCFDRLPEPEAPTAHHDHGDHHDPGPGGWLRGHRDGWRRSGLGWDDYLRGWAEAGGLHPGAAILAALDARFTGDHLVAVPYFFPDLPGTTAADEQAALDAGRLPPSAFLYRGRWQHD